MVSNNAALRAGSGSGQTKTWYTPGPHVVIHAVALDDLERVVHNVRGEEDGAEERPDELSHRAHGEEHCDEAEHDEAEQAGEQPRTHEIEFPALVHRPERVQRQPDGDPCRQHLRGGAQC